MPSGYRHAAEDMTIAINPRAGSERATPSISRAESVWSSVFETQYEPRSVFQPTSRRRSPL